MKEQKNIENIFKEAFEDFELDPGKDAWQKVQSGLNSGLVSGSAASSATTSSWAVTAIVALVISGVAIGGYYFFNQKGEAKLEASFEKNILKTELNELESQIQETESDELNSTKIKSNQTPPSVSIETSKTESKGAKTLTTNKAKGLNNENSDTKQGDLKSNDSDRHAEATKVITQESETEKSNLNTNESSTVNTTPPAEAAAPEEATVETDDAKKSNESNGDDLIESNPLQSTAFAEDTINIYIPNVLTPNSDGTNDIIKIDKEQSKGLKHIDNIQVTIFNKTGKKVANWNGVDGSWDGILQNGSIAAPGAYIYLCTFTINGEAQPPRKDGFTLLY